MQIDTNKTLRQLYEEGVIRIGTRLYMEVPKGREYVSKVERNGYKNQIFTSLDIESEGKYFWEIALEPKNNKMFVIGKSFGYVVLKGAEGCVYGIEELNSICDKMFTTDYLKARSINIDDVNRVLGVEIIYNKVIQKEISYKDISRQSKLGFKYQYGERRYSPESYLRGEYEKANKEIECNFYFYKGESIQEKQIEKDIIFREGKFWLASPGVYCDGGRSRFTLFGLGGVGSGDVCSGDCGMFNFYGDGSGCGIAVRPVGILKSDIPIKDLPISEIVIPRLRIKLS